ncbi:MAG: metal ABC transporter substrate-binding protein [Halomonadaceae bacterium]|nr:MAG: metal ABC transporter substrate-binding protein [Halomonadaceae bacterium]
MIKPLDKWLLAALLLLCSLPGFSDEQGDEPVRVVASFSVLGDWVQQVGGERVALTTLVGADADAHIYQPTPGDARALSQAQLLVINGLHFEGWVTRLHTASGFSGHTLTATDGIVPLVMHDDDHHGEDPHAWHSVANARVYVGNIRDALITVDPDHGAHYRQRAQDYLAQLEALEEELQDIVASLPPERRQVITSHDAFGYLAQAYDLQFSAPKGLSTEAEASAADMAAIIRQIREQQIPAVFLESSSDTRLVRQIARETDARIGGTLYADALSRDDGPAGTYQAMMRHNIHTLVQALSPTP